MLGCFMKEEFPETNNNINVINGSSKVTMRCCKWKNNFYSGVEFVEQ